MIGIVRCTVNFTAHVHCLVYCIVLCTAVFQCLHSLRSHSWFVGTNPKVSSQVIKSSRFNTFKSSRSNYLKIEEFFTLFTLNDDFQFQKLQLAIKDRDRYQADAKKFQVKPSFILSCFEFIVFQ